jgi:predicted DNA-binding transcriptional regulator AlpA
MTDDRYLRLKELKERIGVSRATIYRWAKDYDFPRPVKLGPGTSAWRQSEVDKWLQRRPRG